MFELRHCWGWRGGVWGRGMKALVVLPFIGFTDCDYCLQAGRIYRSWACLGVKNKGGWFGFDRGFVFKGGSSEPLEPPLVTGMIKIEVCFEGR